MAQVSEMTHPIPQQEPSGPASQTGTGDLPLRDVTSVDVRSLRPGTTVTVDTHNSRYRLIKLDGTERSVLIQGGRLFPDSTEGRVDGSTPGGTLLHLGSIDVGYFLELSVAGDRVVTSRISSISVEPSHP